MARKTPRYGVFIIESMDWENEQTGKLDGYALKIILDLSDIPNEYYYIRTELELRTVMDKFRKSEFGFLHISCHGDEFGLSLTIDGLEFEQIGDIMGPYLKYRRLFLSACKAACRVLAEQFVPRYHCYSLIGSPDAIDYDKSAILWSSFYYLMYVDNKKNMRQDNLIKTLQDVTRLFREPMNYYSILSDNKIKSRTHLREIHFAGGDIVVSRTLKTKFENLYWNERFE